jgi:hypothetical protein
VLNRLAVTGSKRGVPFRGMSRPHFGPVTSLCCIKVWREAYKAGGKAALALTRLPNRSLVWSYCRDHCVGSCCVMTMPLLGLARHRCGFRSSRPPCHRQSPKMGSANRGAGRTMVMCQCVVPRHLLASRQDDGKWGVANGGSAIPTIEGWLGHNRATSY